MLVKVEILPWLSTAMHPEVTGRIVIDHEMEGTSFRDLLQELADGDAEFARVVYDRETREMRYPALAAVNDQMLEFLKGLETPLAEGDKVTFVATYTGGMASPICAKG